MKGSPRAPEPRPRLPPGRKEDKIIFAQKVARARTKVSESIRKRAARKNHDAVPLLYEGIHPDRIPHARPELPAESGERGEEGLMQRTYNALNGEEALRALLQLAQRLAKDIPGFNSRLVTFPRLKISLTVRIEAFDREPREVSDVDDLIEKLVLEGVEPSFKGDTAEYEAEIDEGSQSADSIRKHAGLQVTKPTLNEVTKQITDAPDPLPAGENLDNVTQFGKPGGATLADGTHYSGRGRVMELETVGLTPGGDVGSNPIREKLKGDPNSTHFKVRRPREQ